MPAKILTTLFRMMTLIAYRKIIEIRMTHITIELSIILREFMLLKEFYALAQTVHEI